MTVKKKLDMGDTESHSDADSRNATFFSAGVAKGPNSIFFARSF